VEQGHTRRRRAGHAALRLGTRVRPSGPDGQQLTDANAWTHWLGGARTAAGSDNPANYHRAVPLTYEQFRFGFANAVSEDEAKELYETFAVPASGPPLFQVVTENVNPWTEVKVDTKNPDRGPLPTDSENSS
jgi:hypothetical protein